MRIVKRLLTADFVRSISTVFFGTVLAQLIPVLAAPLLTRLYSPEDFGVFSSFLSVGLIFAAFSTGKFELAIMLPKLKGKAFYLFCLSVGSALVLNTVFFIIIAIFSKEISSILNNPKIEGYLYLCPVLALIVSIYVSGQYLANRDRQYIQIARSKVLQTFISTLFQLLTAKSFGVLGLLGGQIVGQGLAVFALGKQTFFRYKKYLLGVSLRRLSITAREYKKFPLFFSMSYGLNTFATNITPVILTTTFGLTYAGLYLLVQRVLAMPVGMVVNSISSVFFQKITTQKDCRKLYLLISGGLFFAATPIVVVMYLYGSEIFKYVFGEEWSIAGEMASLLVIMYWFSLSTNPVSQFSTVHQKVFYNIVWQILLLLSIFTAWYFGKMMDDIFIYLKIFITLQSVLYLVGYCYEYYLCAQQVKQG